MKTFLFLTIVCSFILAAERGSAADKVLLQAEGGKIDGARAEVVEQKSFKSGKGVSLKPGVESQVDSEEADPDLVFQVRASEPGRYVFRTHAAVDDVGREIMAKAKTKHESIFLKIAVGESRPTKRVVFVPWSGPDSYYETLGKFELSGADEEVRVWLPKNVRLDSLELIPYVPPKVPQEAAEYEPKIVPPATRPRLWVNAETLPQVRDNLTKGENAELWKKVQEAAGKRVELDVIPGERMGHDSAIEAAMVDKAFVYLMSGDRTLGREAVDLAQGYLEAVEFNNLLDITREIGRAMYAAARVYDWCYDLLTEEERKSFLRDFKRLADDMEIGWPPFKQSVVNGHGSEAQLHCHLLAMAIAIYDEDPVPYQYCAYRVLEELVPMRDFEYQSPRHHQGIGYGIYRFAWDMHAALLFQRMSGEKIFDPNIEDVYKYWLYMRLPDGHSLPDGDGNVDGRQVNLGITALLISAYGDNPIMKWDFLRQGGLPHDPILVLLLNDPDLKPSEGLASLPLTVDFGKVLGGMVARTGWAMEKETSDVIVAMTGGGYHFSNHQQADAGSFQVYYDGVQVADLGQYVFYGTPYDISFNKRSIAHSMMLAYDPDEKFRGGKIENDGGARFVSPSPRTPEMVKSDPMYANGKVLSADFGPDEQVPDYSYFSVDLASAYSEKVQDYVRTFCFLNLKDEKVPAALIVLDNMETSGPDIKKYWQVNTLVKPETSGSGLMLSGKESGEGGKVLVQMLRPEPGDREVEILSGKDANSVFGVHLVPPKADAPQANGHRVMFSPLQARETDTFLTVLTMADSAQTRLPVDVAETSDTFVLSMADRVVVLSRTGQLMDSGIPFEVKGDGDKQVLIAGLKPGKWSIKNSDGVTLKSVEVQADQNTAFAVLAKGQYAVAPER